MYENIFTTKKKANYGNTTVCHYALPEDKGYICALNITNLHRNQGWEECLNIQYIHSLDRPSNAQIDL